MNCNWMNVNLPVLGKCVENASQSNNIYNVQNLSVGEKKRRQVEGALYSLLSSREHLKLGRTFMSTLWILHGSEMQAWSTSLQPIFSRDPWCAHKPTVSGQALSEPWEGQQQVPRLQPTGFLKLHRAALPPQRLAEPGGLSVPIANAPRKLLIKMALPV